MYNWSILKINELKKTIMELRQNVKKLHSDFTEKKPHGCGLACQSFQLFQSSVSVRLYKTKVHVLITLN